MKRKQRRMRAKKRMEEDARDAKGDDDEKGGKLMPTLWKSIFLKRVQKRRMQKEMKKAGVNGIYNRFLYIASSSFGQNLG